MSLCFAFSMPGSEVRNSAFSDDGRFRDSNPIRDGPAPGVFGWGYLLTLFLELATPTTNLLRRSYDFVRLRLLSSAFEKLNDARPTARCVALAPQQPNTLEEQSNKMTLLMNSGFFEHPSQVTAARGTANPEAAT